MSANADGSFLMTYDSLRGYSKIAKGSVYAAVNKFKVEKVDDPEHGKLLKVTRNNAHHLGIRDFSLIRSTG